MNKPYDLILWGATGFTGQLVAEYLARRYGVQGSLRWAIGGRSAAKLAQVRQQLTAVTPEATNLPILVGNSHDEPFLANMVQQTHVVCSTVGPYAFYGTPLVAACVQHGVAYCDLTGEIPWIRQIIDTYHEQAIQSGARIVHCCGVDSIPSDLGCLMMQEAALAAYGRPCSEMEHTYTSFKGGISGGTFASLLNVATAASKDKQLGQLMTDPYALMPDGPRPTNPVRDQQTAVWSDNLQSWTVPFIMAGINTRVVNRSNALLNYRYGPDFRFQENMKVSNSKTVSYLFSGSLALGMGMMGIGPLRKVTQKLLPNPGSGPSQAVREAGHFTTRLFGVVPDANGQPAHLLEGRVVGHSDPGYGETAKMLGETAVCLALDDLPQQGGVLTTASAMGMTLVERLRRAGMEFTVIDEKQRST